jgi:RNA polymerase sigma factor (sigma-70 family)
MATGDDNGIIHHLRRAALLHDADDLTDGQLLERFLAAREEAAFEVLLRRHGPMVLGVCRRVLSNGHDAEDAFQATFLVLIRKGPSLLPRPTLGSWLHGVAYRTALKARAARWKRCVRERQAAAMSEARAPAEVRDHDLLLLLDRELDRLPARYRDAVVLCELQGKTREGAARQLGVPVGTLSGRLTTARRLLARRLTRRGVTLSATALEAVLTPSVASAGVPTMLVSSTLEAAAKLAAGQAASGALSAGVAALTQDMLKSMLLAKLKRTTVVLLTALALGGGAGGFAYHRAGQAAAPPAASRASSRPGLPEGGSGSAALPPQPPAKSRPGGNTHAGQSDRERLQGAWVPVEAVINGKATDPSDKKVRRSALTFAGDEASLWGFKGPYKLGPDQSPRHLEIVLTVKDRTDVVKAIYQFDGDRLVVSWITGGERPADFDTGKREGVCIVYEKTKQ